jgi:plastocyanin
MRRAVSALTILALAAMLVACSQVANAPGRTGDVSIKDQAFSPSTIQTQVGSTVTWTNNDAQAHHLVANNGSFDSGVIQPGQVWKHTFSTPGGFAYHCALHPSEKGSVTAK